MITKRNIIAILPLLGFCFAAQAEGFPDKPIRIIVPVAAGGSADLLGRLVGQQLSELYKQPVVVENKAGASGHIGAEYVSKQAPDGYTLLIGIQPVQASYAIYPKLNYDPGKSLDTLGIIGSFPSVVLVHPSVAANDIGDLIKLAKASPDALNFGSAGPGSATHLGAELFLRDAGVKMMHVPYKGSSAASADLMGGQIQLMFENLPTAIGLMKSGKVRALAVTGAKRSPSLPNLPTVAEQGVPKYEFVGWYTVAAPLGLPPEVAKKLSADIHKIVHSQALAARWADLGVTPIGGTVAQSNAYVHAEAVKYTKLIKDAGLGL